MASFGSLIARNAVKVAKSGTIIGVGVAAAAYKNEEYKDSVSSKKFEDLYSQRDELNPIYKKYEKEATELLGKTADVSLSIIDSGAVGYTAQFGNNIGKAAYAASHKTGQERLVGSNGGLNPLGVFACLTLDLLQGDISKTKETIADARKISEEKPVETGFNVMNSIYISNPLVGRAVDGLNAVKSVADTIQNPTDEGKIDTAMKITYAIMDPDDKLRPVVSATSAILSASSIKPKAQEKIPSEKDIIEQNKLQVSEPKALRSKGSDMSK